MLVIQEEVLLIELFGVPAETLKITSLRVNISSKLSSILRSFIEEHKMFV